MNGFFTCFINFYREGSSVNVPPSKVRSTEFSEGGEILDCFQGRAVGQHIGVFHHFC